MNRLSLVLLALASSWHANSQQQQLAIKVYNLATYEKQIEQTAVSTDLKRISTNKTFTLLHPTVAVQWKNKKGKNREIELTTLSFKHEDQYMKYSSDSMSVVAITSGNKVSTASIGLRYECTFLQTTPKSSKTLFSFAYAVNPFVKIIHTVPYTSSSYPTSNTSLGLNAFLVPRMNYNLSSKLFVDFNLPINLFSTYMLHSRNSDPSIQVADQSNSSFNFDALSNVLSARIGLGIKL